jgi:hypothetical protein
VSTGGGHLRFHCPPDNANQRSALLGIANRRRRAAGEWVVRSWVVQGGRRRRACGQRTDNRHRRDGGARAAVTPASEQDGRQFAQSPSAACRASKPGAPSLAAEPAALIQLGESERRFVIFIYKIMVRRGQIAEFRADVNKILPPPQLCAERGVRKPPV